MIPPSVLFLFMASVTRPQVGDPVPAFSAQTLAGTLFKEDKLQGHVTVVDFFATWCSSCNEGLAEILAVRKKLGARFDMMIVAVEGDTPALRNFVASHPLPAGIMVVLERDGVLARAFGEDRLPTTFFLDAQALIRHINRGYGSGFRARATRWLSEMIAGNSVGESRTRRYGIQ
jgi:thiol-disulfide isomerase/thioredoxin